MKVMSKKNEKRAANMEPEYVRIPDSDLTVRVSVHTRKDGSMYLQGIACDSKTLYRLSPAIKYTRTWYRGEAKESCQRMVVNLVRAAYQKRVKGENAEAENFETENKFLLALDEYLNNGSAFHDWAENTQKQYCGFYRRIFEHLKDAQDNSTLNNYDLEPIKEVLTNQVARSKNSIKSKERNDQRVERIILQGSAVYTIVSGAWNVAHPGSRLPQLLWSVNRSKSIKKEQAKMLDSATRERFCERLYDLSETYPAFVKGAVLMMLNLRTAEAAAITEADVRFVSDDARIGAYCVVEVSYQTTDGITRIESLKTEQSHRVIPGGYWHTEVLRKCFAALRLTGSTGMTAPAVLSAWILNLLREAGCNIESLTPPASESRNIGDLAAYILRRDAASLMKNQVGMTSYEIDYLLGHKTKGSQTAHPDLRLKEEQKRLVEKMNRFCYMRTLTKAPAVTPIQLPQESELQTIPYVEMRLQMPQRAARCELEIVASEPGESISIVCPAEIADRIKFHSRKEEIKSRPALGCITKEEDYEEKESEEKENKN